MKIDLKKIFIVGLGFFVINMIWAVCNITVPVYLDKLGLAGFIIGAVMAVDNLFAMVFQPIFGVLSDKTNTPYGKRMPYLLIGIPASAICFFLISLSSGNLTFLLIFVVLLGFAVSIFRTPTVGLMYDLTPGPLRRKANWITNLMGGIGAVLALLLGTLLYDSKAYYPFAIVSIISILTIIIMYNMVHEPSPAVNDEPVRQAAAETDRKGRKLNLVFLLVGAFFWFAAFSTLETFFSTYAQSESGLGVSMSTSFLLFLVFSILLVAFAVPSEVIAAKLGRKNTVMYGLIILAGAFLGLIFIKGLVPVFILMGIAGAGWTMVNINSYVMVAELSFDRGIGKYTGFYYTVSMLAGIISPILFGSLKDGLGDGFLFIFTSIAIVFAIFFTMLVKHGESASSAPPLEDAVSLQLDGDGPEKPE